MAIVWYMKYFIELTLYRIVTFIIRIITYIVGLIIHPSRNISFWIVVLLTFFFNINGGITLSGKDMFLFSVGLVTILTFIVTYLDSHTLDLSKKENYYLGYNVKKQNLYNNSWINNFNEVPIKLFLWIAASFPVIKIGLNFKYNIDMVEKAINYLKNYHEYLDSIWLSVVIVLCFYCASILIESVYLSRSSFHRSRLYDNAGKYVKYIIELEIKKQFKTIFRNLFKGAKSYDLVTKSSLLTNLVFKEADKVTNNDEEFIKYINIVYSEENATISKFLTRVDFLIKNINKENNKRVIKEIMGYVLKQRLNELRGYYTGKWNHIEQSKVLSPLFLMIVSYDLRNLMNLEKRFNSNKEEPFQIYREVFWGTYYNKKYLLPIHYDKEKENICIAQIVDITRQKLKDCKFYDELIDIGKLYDLFGKLNEASDTTNNRSYLSGVFGVFYDCTLSSIKDNEIINKRELSSVIDDSVNYLHHDFFKKEMSKSSYNKLLSGSEISNNELKFILKYLNFKDVIITLIFTLAYNERSYKGIISKDQFKIWKSRIREFKNDEKNNLEYLKKYNFDSELFDAIEQSNISHFIYKSFLEWVWKSLFTEFGEEEYKEFHILGTKGIRRNFSLSSYIVLRILVLQNEYSAYNILGFNDNDKIREELSQIQDILKEEDLC